MIADVEPLSGVRRYPSLPLGSSWERHNSALQSNTFPKQASGQHDLMLFGNEDPSSSGLAPSLLCPPSPGPLPALPGCPTHLLLTTFLT